MAYYQNHRLSIKSASTLANLLVECLLLNETIESFREALAKTPYFDTLGLFRFLDRKEKGFLCEKDIHKIIGTSHRKLLTYAFTWMDNLKIGEISRFQFAAFLLPRDNLELRETVAERLQHPQIDPCQQQTILQQYGIFRQMILQIMRREMKLIQLRRSLLATEGYSSKGVIMAIDSSRHDWVCIEDIFKFIKNYGFDVNLRQVQRLVEMLNYNIDGKVTEKQLKWTVEGFEGRDKNYLAHIKISNKKQPPKKPTNFQQNFFKHIQEQAKNGQAAEYRYPVEGIYQQLVQKRRLIELEEREADKNLIIQQEISEKFNRAEWERERINMQLARKMQAARKAREREEWLARKERERQIQNLMAKTSALEAETERLTRLQKKIAIAQDTARIKKSTFQPPFIAPLTYPYRPEHHLLPPVEVSFGEDLSKMRHLRQSRSEAIRTHVQSSQAYLEATRNLREKIRQQRQIERQIHQQFLSAPGRKFGTYFAAEHSNQQGTKRVFDIISTNVNEKVPGQLKGRRKQSLEEGLLGLETNQKRLQAEDGIQISQSMNGQLSSLGNQLSIDRQFETPHQKVGQGREKVIGSTATKS